MRDQEEEEDEKSMSGLDEEVSILDGLEFETDNEEEDDQEEDERQDSIGGEILNEGQQKIFDKLPMDMRNEPGFLEEMMELEVE